MYSSKVFVFCVLICYVQVTFTQYLHNPLGLSLGIPHNYPWVPPQSPYGLSYPGYGLAGHYGVADVTTYGLGAGCGAYGGAGAGNVAVAGELPVGGATALAGQVPIIGGVRFDGAVSATGAVTISGICGCPYRY